METRPSLKLFILGNVAFVFSLVAFGIAEGQSPSPFDVSKVDFSKISDADIAKTEAHKHAEELELTLRTTATAKNLEEALANARSAQTSLAEYEAKVDSLAIENAQNYKAKLDAEKSVAEKNAAILRRDILIAGLGLAIGAYLFLKFYLHLPI